MLLSSPQFFVFFLSVCLFFWLAHTHRRLQHALLLAANLFFLAKFGLIYLLLPIAATADFFLAQQIPSEESPRKTPLFVSLVLNLGLLIGLKLTPLLTHGRYAWLFTLSLSFYVFQSLSYVIDVYRDECKPATDYLSYLAGALFFPSIVAGPIPRQQSLLRQLARPFRLTEEQASRALLLIATGLIKKLLIADYLADNLVNRVFDTPALYSGLENLIAVYGYALQLFFDFSGYSDIAIGAALLLGLDLPINFRRPYLSINLQDFWKRWHISFSSWLTDYVFDTIPKNRNRLRLSYCTAFMITFLLGGLWHGITLNFVVWGALHGIGLSCVFLWQRARGRRTGTRLTRILCAIATFHYVCFTWIFFRASSIPDALSVLQRIGSFTFGHENLALPVLGVLILAAALLFIPEEWFTLSVRLANRIPFWAQGLALAAVVLLIQSLAGQGSANFVYGNF